MKVDKDITQYMHQVACIYIAVPQQKWNNTYLETTYKLEGGRGGGGGGGGILQTIVFKIKS